MLNRAWEGVRPIGLSSPGSYWQQCMLSSGIAGDSFHEIVTDTRTARSFKSAMSENSEIALSLDPH